MDIIGISVVLIIVVVVLVIYRADPTGWMNTYRRSKAIATAHLNARKPVEVKRKKQLDAAKEWEAEFAGKALEAAPSNLPHKIVKTWFQLTVIGSYKAQWKCKCGSVGGEWVSVYGEEGAVNEAKRTASEHVSSGNKYTAMTGDRQW